MITPTEALTIVLDNARPLKATSRPLNEALGCCLAEQVRADRDQPPTDRSAMDGYAVRARDLSRRPRELRLVGEVAAGGRDLPKVEAGTCVRILTGAVVPPGADAVVKLEDTEEGAGAVTFLEAEATGANIRRQGEEVREGEVVLNAGTVLGPAQIGLCALLGKAVVSVHRRPRPTVLCTGAELRDVGEKVRPHELRNSNGPALCASLNGAGYDEVVDEIVPDDPGVLAAKLAAAAEEHDVLILTGGVSVGKYDFVPEAVKRIGAAVRFHGVRMKPGKPQLYATLNGNRHIFALPGNPLSVLTGFYELVLPALRRMSGRPAESCRPRLRLPLGRALRCKGDRVQFVLAKLTSDEDGSRADPVESRGSADLAAGARADGVIVVSPDVREIPAGALVEFRPWGQAP